MVDLGRLKINFLILIHVCVCVFPVMFSCDTTPFYNKLKYSLTKSEINSSLPRRRLPILKEPERETSSPPLPIPNQGPIVLNTMTNFTAWSGCIGSCQDYELLMLCQSSSQGKGMDME